MPSFAFITGLLLLAAPGSQDPWLHLHQQALVFDAHADSLGRVLDLGVDLGKRQADGHLDFRRMQEGGLDAQFFSIWVDPERIRSSAACA